MGSSSLLRLVLSLTALSATVTSGCSHSGSNGHAGSDTLSSPGLRYYCHDTAVDESLLSPVGTGSGTYDSQSSVGTATQEGSSTSAAAKLIAEHVCIHDTPEMQQLLQRDLHVAEQKYKTRSHTFGSAAAMTSNMRFAVSTLDLDDSTKYCTSAGQTVTNFQGGTATCTSDDIFTAAKKAILLDKVLPAALKILSGALLVDPVVGNLSVGSGCSFFTTPNSHTTSGVPDADYALYVAAGPTSSGTVAWAGACATDGNGRPVTGRANFSPKYLVWSDSDLVGQRTLVRTAVHEILHALGFSGGFWSSLALSKGKTITTTETRRGTDRTVVVSTGAASAAQAFFNCATLTGPEVEDEGGSGTAGSHWERRTHYDDVMAGVVGDSMYLSAVTLGVMSDLGFYGTDSTKAETPKWLAAFGCGAHESDCTTAAGGLGSYFCTVGSTRNTCTYDYTAVGVCTSVNYMNGCSAIVGYSNRQCANPQGTAANDTISGFYFASDSKCFKTPTHVLQTGYTTSDTTEGVCLRFRCLVDGDTQVVEFAINSSGWIRCTTTGSALSLSSYGYQGSVTCPSPSTHCPTLDLSNNNVTLAPVTTTRTTTTLPSGATAGTTTTSTTTTATSTTTTTTPLPTTTVAAPQSVPPIVAPISVRPLAPVTNFILFTLFGQNMGSMLKFYKASTASSSRMFSVAADSDESGGVYVADPANEAFLNAIIADVGTQLGITSEEGASIVIDQHVPTTVTVASSTYQGFTFRLLVSTSTRATGFLLSMWSYALNRTAASEPVTWMTQTQLLYAASGASDAFAIAGQQITEPTKDSSFLGECGPLGCIATVAVATMGGWAAAVLVAVSTYHWFLVRKGHQREEEKQRLRHEREVRRKERELKKGGGNAPITFEKPVKMTEYDFPSSSGHARRGSVPPAQAPRAVVGHPNVSGHAVPPPRSHTTLAIAADHQTEKQINNAPYK